MDAGNWLALLKWSILQNDGTVPSDAQPMSSDDKAFLEAVMKDLVKDEAARMNEIMTKFITLLNDEQLPIEEVDTDSIEDELEELRDIVEQVDMAQIFAKFGGLKCLLGLLNREQLPVSIRALAAATMATLSQNNITVQDLVYSQGIFDSVVDTWRTKCTTSEAASKLRPKLIFAMSCMIRGHAALEEHFVMRVSEDVIPTALDSASFNSALVVRVCFLVNALITSDSCTVQRIEVLLDRLLPSLLKYIHSTPAAGATDTAAGVDLQDTVLQLIETLLYTTPGRARLTASVDSSSSDRSSLINELDALESVLLAAVASVNDESEDSCAITKEEAQHQLSLIRNIKQLVHAEEVPARYPVTLLSSSIPVDVTATTVAIAAEGEGSEVGSCLPAVSDDEKKSRVGQFSNSSALVVSPPPAPSPTSET